MRVVAFSDIHNQQHGLKLPPGDLLIFAGDHGEWGNEAETNSFLKWFSERPHEHKIFCAGNHDRFLERSPGFFKQTLEEFPNLIYLQDEEITIEGLRIYAMPHTPKFGYDWAFNSTPEQMKTHCAKIPSGLDILITHGPAYGIQDYVPSSRVHAGCGHLFERIEETIPRYHFFGHIHRDKQSDQTGEYIGKNTKFYNVSIMDERTYKPLHHPVVVDIEPVAAVE